MRVIVDLEHWRLICACGYQTPFRCTLEAAGRDMDLHLAKQFPNPKERMECPEVHNVPRSHNV